MCYGIPEGQRHINTMHREEGITAPEAVIKMVWSMETVIMLINHNIPATDIGDQTPKGSPYKLRTHKSQQ